MVKILLPVDGSAASDKTMTDFIQLLDWYKKFWKNICWMANFLAWCISMLIDKDTIQQCHHEDGVKKTATGPWVAVSSRAGLPGTHKRGRSGEKIAQFAVEQSFDRIDIGPYGSGAVKTYLLGVVANKLIKLSSIPVLVLK